MANLEYTFYKGRKFWIQSNGRYFQDGSKTRKERLLHRVIWSDHNGPIPEGMCVHHKDRNWRNNDLSNLELMPHSDHSRMHTIECMREPEYARTAAIGLEKAREAAKAWHSSEAGKLWHSQHGKDVWAKRTKKTFQCVVCGKACESVTRIAKYCSTRCRNKYAIKKYTDSVRNCVVCNKEFVAFKYLKTRHCSSKCSAISVARIKRGIQPHFA